MGIKDVLRALPTVYPCCAEHKTCSPLRVDFIAIMSMNVKIVKVLQNSGRAQRLQVVCGDKSPAKAARKRLERKRTELEDATAALRSLPASTSPLTLSAVVSNLQVSKAREQDLFLLLPFSSQIAFNQKNI